MGGFGDYFLHQEYTKIAGLGNKLGEVRDLIDWEKFRPILSDMYRDNKETGGRPHTDEILMIKMLALAGWHGLSDYEVELLATDRLSFRHFLGYPDKIPDRSKVWLFRENLTEKGKIHLIWDELQRQLDEHGYKMKRGSIQDASFITSDPGHAPADKPRRDAVKPGEAGTDRGRRKVLYQDLDTNFIHLSTKNTRSSDDSTLQLHPRTIVRSISPKRVKRYTMIKDISEQFPSHRWIKP